MCGVAGILCPRADRGALMRMTRMLAHRGPDDEGFWLDHSSGIALGHRRLAVVDLSPAGHQPMHSGSGRFVITLNGEIYNFRDLRGELSKIGPSTPWRGHSDTEVLLAGFDAWGIAATLKRVKGMFALAVWDKRFRTLTLARDRLGEKPLYYGRQNGPNSPFLFASELKALRGHPDFNPEIDPRSVSLFTRYLNVPAPFSIYRGISKLLPGTMLTVRQAPDEPVLEEYWSGAELVRSASLNPVCATDTEAVGELEQVLERAIERQTTADVPIGAFLSGGVDSSTVAALMQKLSRRPIKTFTVGFHEKGYNEAEHASLVARHLGTDHTELYVTASEALDVIPQLPAIYDEPFADSSQIPTCLISALARRQVTVALSGDGGDELFGGYNRYLLSRGIWNRVRRVPKPLRVIAGRMLASLPAATWSLPQLAGNLMQRKIDAGQLAEKANKVASSLEAGTNDELYERLTACWPPQPSIMQAAADAPAVWNSFQGIDGPQTLMARDMLGYLPDDILVKLDRAAMAVSLETRTPLLDPEVVEFAWRLPLEFKLRGNKTKWLLRQVLYRHVPSALIERPKRGFSVPLDQWLRGPLRGWAEDLLTERRLTQEGWFNSREILRVWEGQKRGRANSAKLWAILMFESWLDTHTGSQTSTAAVSAGAVCN